MVRQILPIASLLLGSGLLLFAGGVNGLILPVRGSAEGFSAVSLGLLGTGWAIGYVLGCIYTPRLVGRVGHIRSFSVMAALAAVAILLSLLMLSPWAWVPLRGLSGFCFAGAAMIVESWLGERTDASTRGRVFGVYTMVNLGASTAGQLALTVGDTSGYLFFVIGAIVYCLALLPTTMSSGTSPRPLVRVSLDLPALWRNSPIAVFAVFCVGISNSAFGTLAAVYADRVGLALTAIAFFASLPIMAGALAQIPVGILSDRTDRRWVLIGLAGVALAADLAFIGLAPEGRALNLAIAMVFGAAVYAMYPVIVAHANDHADDDAFIQVSGGLLLVYGVGAIAGPLAAGVAMSWAGNTGLFMTSLAAHVLIIGFALMRIRARPAKEAEAKTAFVAISPARAATPETAALATGDEDDADSDATPTARPAGDRPPTDTP